MRNLWEVVKVIKKIKIEKNNKLSAQRYELENN
jgi:hypothetical protein